MGGWLASGALRCRRAESKDMEHCREYMEVTSAHARRCMWLEGGEDRER